MSLRCRKHSALHKAALEGLPFASVVSSSVAQRKGVCHTSFRGCDESDEAWIASENGHIVPLICTASPASGEAARWD